MVNDEKTRLDIAEHMSRILSESICSVSRCTKIDDYKVHIVSLCFEDKDERNKPILKFYNEYGQYLHSETFRSRRYMRLAKKSFLRDDTLTMSIVSKLHAPVEYVSIDLDIDERVLYDY